MNYGKATLCVTALVMLCCSGSQVRERLDASGRVSKKEFYVENRLDHIEEIAYAGDSKSPERVVYLRHSEGRLLPYHEKVFSYAGGAVSKIQYYIYIGDKKLPSGRITYSYDAARLQKSEYHSISDLAARRMFLSALDVYTYNGDGDLVSRRIIEYGYNHESGSGMQLSQYLIGYKKHRAVSMDASILDKKSNGIVQIKETSRAIVAEMVGNIEKNINERAKGTGLLRKNGTVKADVKDTHA